jgi:circadian clock protein KaiB
MSGSSKSATRSEQRISPEHDSLARFEELVASLAQPDYLFRLYVAGGTARSTAAIGNVRRICDQYLPGRYQLEVIDVYQNRQATRDRQLLAVPTLIKEMPLPVQRFVGDLSNTERIVIGLNLKQ